MPDIAYHTSGSGRDVVLIHGFCETKEMWERFQYTLSARYRVSSIDLPGFGESILKGTSLSIDEVAKAVKSSLSENNIVNPVVIGHSLGGYVALALAERMETGLSGLCLFHSTALADDEEKIKTRNKTLTFFEKYGTKPFVESFVPQLFAEDKRETLKDSIEQLIDRANKIPVEVLMAYTRAMRDRPERIEVLTTQTLSKAMIAGALDTAISVENSRKHKKWVDFYLELADTGHMGMFERPNETLAFLEEYLEHCFDG
ncbi:hydrolase of the alpha/beta superfamily [Lunatimonas lonarensis]|uniref:Hydrolase of the alpha/beta superfamily n=1 Tax=Lunatimonas lonarensis TaxID=1232681 RepID=R7ZRR6_9BACT|nr:alpha/beta hydrolase [Lunatimonas lonarensis]EON76846.1 hydrolase of the alpha/beta superfamily [Lunatimonas lonarensis]